MKDILFVTVSENLTLREEVNGTMILATKLKQAGFDTDVLRFGQIETWRKDYTSFIKDITRRILEIRPRCLSFYCLCGTYHIVLRIAMEVRRQANDICILFGGPQATVTAAATLEAFDCVDYVATGQGEETVVDLFTALLRQGGQGIGEIPGLCYRKDGVVVSNTQPIPICELDTLPRWDESLLPPGVGDHEPGITAKDYFMPIDTGRGCPFNCTFCSTSYFWHRKYRLKSPQRIVADMEYHRDRYGIRSFDVAHDAFTINNKLVEEVCDLILERGLDISWRCTTRIDCISKELLLKMKNAGLDRIALGVETGSPRMQKLIHKRLNLDTVKPMVKFLVENDIKVTLFFIHGFPEETEEELRQTLDLAFSCMELGARRITLSICQFDPCTELTTRYYDGLVLKPEIKLLCGGFGCKEEMDMIRDNKFLFSHRYQYDTPLRDEYRNLAYLGLLYTKFRETMCYIRSCYTDDLQLYRDLYAASRDYFEGVDGKKISMERPQEMIYRMLEAFPIPRGRQIKARMEFSDDLKAIANADTDTVIHKNYDFSFIDYQMKVPMAKLADACSEILLQKINGKVEMKLLDLQYNG